MPDTAPIAQQRLENQRLVRQGGRDPADMVAWFGAVQAQEYPAAKWALALRMPDGTTDARIERAFNDGRILRTHVLRPTWHFVAASDLHWMLELTAPRVHRALTYGYRMLELDLALRNRAAGVIERALGGGQCLTRAELGASSRACRRGGQGRAPGAADDARGARTGHLQRPVAWKRSRPTRCSRDERPIRSACHATKRSPS